MMQQSPQQQQQQQTKIILKHLDELSHIIPLSPQENDNDTTSTNTLESKFLSAVREECIPGRDDSSKNGAEINPTTHRKRECLRHVPLGKKNTKNAASAIAIDNAGLELEERRTKQKPRIGIMIPPGYISMSFARWVGEALKSSTTGDDGILPSVEIEILVTSHVPVYGYGKSHGFTKIIRFVTLPVSLAAYDAYLLASSSSSSEDEVMSDGNHDFYKGSSLLQDTLDEMKLGRNLSPPSTSTIGTILQLILRWHCRLSHVSAHTAMLTLSLDDVIKDPTDVLARILGFVWREDWEWEGRGGGKHPQEGLLPQRTRSWQQEAEDLVENHGGSLQKMLEQTSLILKETTSSATSGNNNKSFQKAIQGAFASEMKRSADMTAWPCPSFWEGVETDGSGGDGDGNDQMRALQRLSEEMVPSCSDDDPFVRCTVNKDRCEVKKDAKCK